MEKAAGCTDTSAVDADGDDGYAACAGGGGMEGSGASGESLVSMQIGNCGRVMCDRTAAACVNHIKHLELLEMSGCYRLSDDGLSKILVACQSSLLTLQLQSNSRLSAQGLRTIRSLEHLRVLNLDDVSHLTAEDLSVLLPDEANCAKDVAQSKSCGVKASASAWKGLQQLHTLSLANIESLTDGFVSNLLYAYGYQLRELSLRGCANLTDETLLSLRSYCGHVQTLDISHMPLLSNAGLLGLFIASSVVRADQSEEQSCGTGTGQRQNDLCLWDINLAGLSSAVDDEVLIHLVESSSGPVLRSLNIASCVNVTNRGIAAITKRCSGNALNELDISFVREVSEDAIGRLVDCCQQHDNLQRIVIWGCSQLTDRFFAAFQTTYIQIVGHMNA